MFCITVYYRFAGCSVSKFIVSCMKLCKIDIPEQFSFSLLRKAGFPDNITTYAIVSGMWACVLSLGSCFGPVLGGVRN